MTQLECLILDITQQWEREGSAQGCVGPIVGAMDEMFLEQMMWVFMDLVSGDALYEEVADDRSYETWLERVKTRLEPMQTQVLYLVSDRARALIKLVQTGLACPSVPDLFHALHDLGKGYSLAISHQLKVACQGLRQAQTSLDQCKASGACEAEVEALPGYWKPMVCQ